MAPRRNWCKLCQDDYRSGDVIIRCQFCPKSFHRECIEHDISTSGYYGTEYDLNTIDLANFKCENCLRYVDETVIENDERCKLCKERNRDDSDVLLLCDGCPNSYHMSCLELLAEPVEEQWFCPMCRPEDFKAINVRESRRNPLSENTEHVNSSICYVCQRHGKLLGCDFCSNSFHHGCLPEFDVGTIGDVWECPCCKGEDPFVNQMHKRWTIQQIERNIRDRRKCMALWKSKISRYRSRFLLAHRRDLAPFVSDKTLAALQRNFLDEGSTTRRRLSKKGRSIEDLLECFEEEAAVEADKFILKAHKSCFYPSGRRIDARPLRVGVALKPHQEDGVDWLLKSFLTGGAILSDEMGLGKTIQTLCFLSYLKMMRIDGPHLIVVPLSTVGNWLREVHRFTPHLTCIKICGSRTERLHAMDDRLAYKGLYDLYITTYETVKNEEAFFVETIPRWQCLILDEAHRIKNATGAVRHSMDRVAANMRLLLTGTPLQNNAAELFTLINFMFPDIFKGSVVIEEAFNKSNARNANHLGDSGIKREDLEAIKLLLSKIMLRRLKEQAIVLPNKIFHDVWLPLSKHSLQWYRTLMSLRSLMKENVSIKKLLGLVIKMRIICGHPRAIVSRPYQTEKLFEFFKQEEVNKQTEIETEANFLRNLKCEEHIEASAKLTFLDKLLRQLHFENCDLVPGYTSKFNSHLRELRASAEHKKKIRKRAESSMERQREIEAENPFEGFRFITKAAPTAKTRHYLSEELYPMHLEQECPYQRMDVVTQIEIREKIRRQQAAAMLESSNLDIDGFGFNDQDNNSNDHDNENDHNHDHDHDSSIGAECDTNLSGGRSRIISDAEEDIPKRDPQLKLKVENGVVKIKSESPSPLAATDGLYGAFSMDIDKGGISGGDLATIAAASVAASIKKEEDAGDFTTGDVSKVNELAKVKVKQEEVDGGDDEDVDVDVDVGVDFDDDQKDGDYQPSLRANQVPLPDASGNQLASKLKGLDTTRLSRSSKAAEKKKKAENAMMHKVLIFTQFQLVLDELEAYCNCRGWKYMRLDGSTNKLIRELDIREFNNPGSPYFVYLISTRAGGLGINLTSANHVVLFDEDWNPFIDLQAIDRAHRIGQKRNVHIWKLISEWTVEERMALRREQKLKLDKLLVNTNAGDVDSAENTILTLSPAAIIKMMMHGNKALRNLDTLPILNEFLDDLVNRGRRKPPEELDDLDNLDVVTKEVQMELDDEVKQQKLVETIAVDVADVMREENAETLVADADGEDVGKKGAPQPPDGLTEFMSLFNGKDFLDPKKIKKILAGREDREELLKQLQSAGLLWRSERERKRPSSMYTPDSWRKRAESKPIRHENKCFCCGFPKNHHTSYKDKNGERQEVDFGELVPCFRCPKSYHRFCERLGDTRKTWTCRWHECCLCFRKSSQCDNLLIHCSNCPTSFCYDCFPPDYTRHYVGEDYYYSLTQRGMNANSTNWIFFLCSKCKISQERDKRRKLTKEERETQQKMQKELRSQILSNVKETESNKRTREERRIYVEQQKAAEIEVENRLRDAYQGLVDPRLVVEIERRIQDSRLKKEADDKAGIVKTKREVTFLTSKLPGRMLTLCENCRLPMHNTYRHPGECPFAKELIRVENAPKTEAPKDSVDFGGSVSSGVAGSNNGATAGVAGAGENVNLSVSTVVSSTGDKTTTEDSTGDAMDVDGAQASSTASASTCASPDISSVPATAAAATASPSSNAKVYKRTACSKCFQISSGKLSHQRRHCDMLTQQEQREYQDRKERLERAIQKLQEAKAATTDVDYARFSNVKLKGIYAAALDSADDVLEEILRSVNLPTPSSGEVTTTQNLQGYISSPNVCNNTIQPGILPPLVLVPNKLAPGSNTSAATGSSGNHVTSHVAGTGSSSTSDSSVNTPCMSSAAASAAFASVASSLDCSGGSGNSGNSGNSNNNNKLNQDMLEKNFSSICMQGIAIPKKIPESDVRNFTTD